MVGVALDTLQVIESYLLTQKYDGLIKSGRIQGRSTSGLAGWSASIIEYPPVGTSVPTVK
jgi:preprotein translocase subunit SecY